MKEKKLIKHMDKPLLILMIFFSLTGMFLILSASNVAAVVKYNVGPYYFFAKQLLFVVVSFIIGFFIIIKIDINKYKGLTIIGLAIVIIFLLWLLLKGTLINNAKSWFGIGVFGIQPSEFAKLLLILYLGTFFGSYTKVDIKDNKLWIALSVCAGVILLVAAQPDYGTALIIALIVFLVFISLPLSKKTFMSVFMVGIGGVVLVVSILLLTKSSILNDMQSSRLTFKNPCERYTADTGYQVCNGFIAIHNGGLFGVGIGESTQKYLYLPEAHTDFIFPILVEEMGVIVGAIILGIYFYMIFRIIQISKRCYNLRNSIICYGIAMFLLIHILINFVGVLALLPLTGVPVPLLSSGGSITLTTLCSLFIVQRINIENNLTKKKLEISKIIEK